MGGDKRCEGVRNLTLPGELQDADNSREEEQTYAGRGARVRKCNTRVCGPDCTK
ncbi:hypothetical protein DAI22_04g013932 [Oryza sativa Japonica Group]|nr:hypothetical protein DAI22_04g013932 [Oryza sativa Japonica Group]